VIEPVCRTENIRNIALAGHASAGKTTLYEALLLAGGVIQVAGSIERGSTVSDADEQEQARAHSIDSCISHIDHHGCHINLIDTAGHADFRGPTLAALAAVETVAVVVNAVNGIEHSTRRMMRHARERKLARMLVINKIDFEGANLAALVSALREEFGNECLPVNLPAGRGSHVLDCFFHAEGNTAGNCTDFSSLAEAHQQIIDQVVEINGATMDRYLDAGEEALTPGQLHDAFEQCLREGHLVPICFVSARTGAGVKEWLQLAERLLPHPGEGNPPPFKQADGMPLTISVEPDAPVIADVFKIINDPFVGKLGVFRLWQGTLRRDSQLLIDDGRKPFKVAHLFRLQGRNHLEVESIVAGDLGAVAKIDDIHFDAVLHDSHEEDAITLEPLAFPAPMYGLAVEPTHKGHEQKLAHALARLAEEDPCFRVEHHKPLNQTVVRGLSELHLKVMFERMRERQGVEVKTQPPRIAYRETIATPAEGHHRHKKQTGGAGQFGEVFLTVEPLPRGAGFEFVDAVRGGVIPAAFLPAIEKGVRQAMGQGAVAGFPLQDIRVTVHDGKHHAVDSKEVAFVSAGRKAFLEAVGKARPLVLEPFVNIEVLIPEHHMGDVTGNLAGKRAKILGTESQRGGELVIKAQVPLAELNDYPTELKSLTGGRGRYSLELSHYEPVPPAVQKQLAGLWKPQPDND
jgi:elongation factor G